MELSDDDCIGSLMLGCVAAQSHALLYVDTLQSPDQHTSSSTSSKKHRKRCDYERLVSLVTKRLFPTDAAAAAAAEVPAGVHVVHFDAAAHMSAPDAALDAAADRVFDALCDTLVPPTAGAEAELLFVDAADECSGVATIRRRQVGALVAREAQHHAVVLVERAEQLLFASDVFAEHLARLLARHHRAVRRAGGTWRVLRDDVCAFSLIFVVARSSAFPGPTHLPSILMDLVLFGARLSHTLFATVAPESLHAVPLQSLAVMRSQLPDVFASAEVLYYLRELVVQLRRHPAFRAGLATETFAAFETAARIAALVDGCMYVSPVHVLSVAAMVVRHRVVLQAGHSVESVLVDVLSRTPVPV